MLELWDHRREWEQPNSLDTMQGIHFFLLTSEDGFDAPALPPVLSFLPAARRARKASGSSSVSAGNKNPVCPDTALKHPTVTEGPTLSLQSLQGSENRLFSSSWMFRLLQRKHGTSAAEQLVLTLKLPSV